MTKRRDYRFLSSKVVKLYPKIRRDLIYLSPQTEVTVRRATPVTQDIYGIDHYLAVGMVAMALHELVKEKYFKRRGDRFYRTNKAGIVPKRFRLTTREIWD